MTFQLRSRLHDLRLPLILDISIKLIKRNLLYVNQPHSVICQSIPRESSLLRNYFDSPDSDQILEATLRSSDWPRQSRSGRCALSTVPDTVYVSDRNGSYVPIAHPEFARLRIHQHLIQFPNYPQAGGIHQNRRDLPFPPSVHY